MGLTPEQERNEQERKKADAWAYIEFMRRSEDLLKDTSTISLEDAQQILNDLNGYNDKYGHALTTGRLETAISDWKKVINEKETAALYSSIVEAYNNQISSIDANLKRNEEMIAGQRENAVKQAYSNYDRSKSTYGQNAEKLARMGLGNSGYSDYLTGVAYGNMVGGIESANTSANEALEKAYYNADQQKLAAASERDKAIAEAEKAYADKEASLIMAINSGEIDFEGAKAIAETYGLTSGTIANLENVYNAYVVKVDEQNKTEAIAYLDDVVKNGVKDEYGNVSYLTEEQIRNYGKQNGLSEEEVNKYIELNKGNVNKAITETIIPDITADTTNEEIDKLDVDDIVKTELKTERDNKVYEAEAKKLQAEIESGNVGMGNIANIDDKFAKGEISHETYQHIYYDRALAFADGIESLNDYEDAIKQVDGYVKQGKMTSENAEKVKEYIAKSIVKVIPSDAYKKGKNKLTGDDVIEIYGELIYLESKDSIDSFRTVYSKKRKQLLDKALEGNENAEIVVFNNGVYYKLDNKWYKIRNLAFLSGKNKIKELAETHTNTVTKPTFTYTK